LAAASITSDAINYDAVGLRRADGTDAVRPSDFFQLGSCTKSMTATLAAMLVEEGKLSWDETIEQAFPDLSGKIDPEYQKTTLRSLLTHRSGAPSLNGGPESFAPILNYSGYPQSKRFEFTADILAKPPAGPVGQFLYSNAGYAIASVMIERAGGEPYERLLRSVLMDPIDVPLQYGLPGASDPDQPWGHFDYLGTPLPTDPAASGDGQELLRKLEGLEGPPETVFTPETLSEVYGLQGRPSALSGAGAATLSAPFFARYVQFHLRNLMGFRTILGPRAAAPLYTPVGAPFTRTTSYVSYAMGWFVLKVKGVPTWFHDGSVDGFVAIMIVQPTRGKASVALCNWDSPDGDTAVYLAAGRLLGISDSDVEESLLPVTNGI
jgi:CubicO group peptidase (beta-lactamase class C family)